MIDANGNKFLTMYSIHVIRLAKFNFFEKCDISSFLAALYLVQSLAPL
jgi:hypothetical protein